MNLFPVVILAGGLATRLYPETKKIPKALIEINGKPFIDHQLNLLYQQGIREVVICVSYLAEQIEEHVQNGAKYKLKVYYSKDGETLLGTGGAIKKALSLLPENFFVLYGDSYLLCDFKLIQEAFLQQNRLGLMTVFRNHGQWDTSNIEYRNGKIVDYDKKNISPHMHYIDYGLGILNQQAFDDVPLNKFYDLAELYKKLLNTNQLGSCEVTERFYEIGSFSGIEETRSLLCNS